MTFQCPNCGDENADVYELPENYPIVRALCPECSHEETAYLETTDDRIRFQDRWRRVFKRSPMKPGQNWLDTYNKSNEHSEYL